MGFTWISFVNKGYHRKTCRHIDPWIPNNLVKRLDVSKQPLSSKQSSPVQVSYLLTFTVAPALEVQRSTESMSKYLPPRKKWAFIVHENSPISTPSLLQTFDVKWSDELIIFVFSFSLQTLSSQMEMRLKVERRRMEIEKRKQMVKRMFHVSQTYEAATNRCRYYIILISFFKSFDVLAS